MKLGLRKKKPEPPSSNDAEILAVLKEIRDKLTDREEQDYSAVLSGIMSNLGPVDGGAGTGKTFSEMARCLIRDMRK